MLTNTSPARAAANIVSNHSDAIRCPDADALSRLQAARDQAARDPFDLAIEFREGEPHRLIRHDERSAIRCFVDGGFEHAVDGAIKQRLLAGARHEASCRWLSLQ